jgi:hypothetical protein
MYILNYFARKIVPVLEKEEEKRDRDTGNSKRVLTT